MATTLSDGLQAGHNKTCRVTICFCNLDNMSDEVQIRLSSFLRQVQTKPKLRIIATIEKPLDMVRAGKLLRKSIISFFKDSIIRISPLRERQDRLPY